MRLKSTDLMVGNWIYCYHPTEERGNAVRVTADTIKSLEMQEHYFITENSPIYRIVEPVELTNNILEKNGFLYDKENELFCIDGLCVSDDERCIFDVGTMGIGFLGDEFRNFVSIVYVHELQQLMKNFGCKKDIEEL